MTVRTWRSTQVNLNLAKKNSFGQKRPQRKKSNQVDQLLTKKTYRISWPVVISLLPGGIERAAIRILEKQISHKQMVIELINTI